MNLPTLPDGSTDYWPKWVRQGRAGQIAPPLAELRCPVCMPRHRAPGGDFSKLRMQVALCGREATDHRPPQFGIWCAHCGAWTGWFCTPNEARQAQAVAMLTVDNAMRDAPGLLCDVRVIDP